MGGFFGGERAVLKERGGDVGTKEKEEGRIFGREKALLKLDGEGSFETKRAAVKG